MKGQVPTIMRMAEIESATAQDVPVFVAQTKQHRKDLDEVLQRLKRDSIPLGLLSTYQPIRSSHERFLAITKIQEAIMWLGMDLKEQNTPNPYPQSYNPKSPVIEPTADNLKL